MSEHITPIEDDTGGPIAAAKKAGTWTRPFEPDLLGDDVVGRKRHHFLLLGGGQPDLDARAALLEAVDGVPAGRRDTRRVGGDVRPAVGDIVDRFDRVICLRRVDRLDRAELLGLLYSNHRK